MVNSLVIKKVTHWTNCSRMTGAFAFAFIGGRLEGSTVIGEVLLVARFCRSHESKLDPDVYFPEEHEIKCLLSSSWHHSSTQTLHREAFRIEDRQGKTNYPAQLQGRAPSLIRLCLFFFWSVSQVGHGRYFSTRNLRIAHNSSNFFYFGVFVVQNEMNEVNFCEARR